MVLLNLVCIGCNKRVLVMVFENESNCLHEGPGTIGGMPSVGVFLRDTSLYLHELRRKPRKTLKGNVDKRDRELNPAFFGLPVLSIEPLGPWVTKGSPQC